MTPPTRRSLLTLFTTRTGRTTHTPKSQDDPSKLTAYWRDRADLSSVADIRRWR